MLGKKTYILHWEIYYDKKQRKRLKKKITLKLNLYIF